MMGERPSSLFLLASFGKQGGSVPCVIEVSGEKIEIDIIKSKSASMTSKLPIVHGYALIKPSFKKTWRKSPRLFTIDESGTALVYKIDLR